MIVTRGMGSKLLVTQGYGRRSFIKFWREVVEFFLRLDYLPRSLRCRLIFPGTFAITLSPGGEVKINTADLERETAIRQKFEKEVQL
jgi:hypothetical protein